MYLALGDLMAAYFTLSNHANEFKTIRLLAFKGAEYDGNFVNFFEFKVSGAIKGSGAIAPTGDGEIELGPNMNDEIQSKRLNKAPLS